MKKTLVITILFVMVALLATTVVNATTSSELADTLYNLGSKYGMTSSDKVKIERYLSDNPVTDDEANQIVAKAQEAVAIMEQAGVTNITELSTAQKNQLKTIANEAASIVGITISIKAGVVEFYKDGKLIETATLSNGKLVYTGNSTNVVVLVVSSIAIVALAAGIVAKKKLANA